jgi:hypothetical protein
MIAGLFLDIESAYDKVYINILVDRLKEIGLPGNLLAFNFNLTSQRENYSSDMKNRSARDGHTGDYPRTVS